MTYYQITSDERYMLAALKKQGLRRAEIARQMNRHPSTIGRELKRNSARYDGCYRPSIAQERTNGRRSRSRRNARFTADDFGQVQQLLLQQWSPDQISWHLYNTGQLSISHETIYRHIWQDKAAGGGLYRHLRGSEKRRRKRYGRNDSRGFLAGKRHISERPPVVEDRTELGHWEIDTVMGDIDTRDCIVTLVERKTGFLMIGKLKDRTAAGLSERVIQLIRKHVGAFDTITADNGSEFHDYVTIEARTQVKFFFANPYHSWERGSNENANGLIRQYLPKGVSMKGITQRDCNAIAHKLNSRPRKRHDYRTPQELFHYEA